MAAEEKGRGGEQDGATEEGFRLLKVKEAEQGLRSGAFHQELSRVYGADAARASGRLLALLRGFCDHFGAGGDTPVCFYSSPGRTEIGGNHTDHQQGRGLAAGVNLDTIACASPTGGKTIRIQSQHHQPCEISLDTLSPVAGELGHSPALVRGVAARIAGMGYPVGGFDAYTTTEVLRGSGLSSSATFEVLTAAMVSHLFCGGALSPADLAQTAQYAENAYYGKPCGLIDQMACAMGGVIAVSFPQRDQPAVEQVAFDLQAAGYALCIVDSGVSHAGLHTEYAAIPREMEAVAQCFDRRYLSQVPEEEFFKGIAAVRERCGDRAVLRAIHFYREDEIVVQELEAVRRRDMASFLRLVNRSGRSSWMYLQNICTYHDPRHQELGVLLAVAQELLEGQGACRVHGGGFAGTIQAFVPLGRLEAFTAGMERVAGKGNCHVLTFRNTGACTLIA